MGKKIKDDPRDGKLRSRKMSLDEKSTLKVIYDDENEFQKMIRSIRKYQMHSYKQFVLKDLPTIRKGNLIGEEYKKNHFKIYYQADSLFEFVHGKIFVYYRLNEENNIVLEKVEPKEFVYNGYRKELPSYKGVVIASPKDRFKADLYFVNQKLPEK